MRTFLALLSLGCAAVLALPLGGDEGVSSLTMVQAEGDVTGKAIAEINEAADKAKAKIDQAADAEIAKAKKEMLDRVATTGGSASADSKPSATTSGEKKTQALQNYPGLPCDTAIHAETCAEREANSIDGKCTWDLEKEVCSAGFYTETWNEYEGGYTNDLHVEHLVTCAINYCPFYDVTKFDVDTYDRLVFTDGDEYKDDGIIFYHPKSESTDGLGKTGQTSGRYLHMQFDSDRTNTYDGFVVNVECYPCNYTDLPESQADVAARMAEYNARVAAASSSSSTSSADASADASTTANEAAVSSNVAADAAAADAAVLIEKPAAEESEAKDTQEKGSEEAAPAS